MIGTEKGNEYLNKILQKKFECIHKRRATDSKQRSEALKDKHERYQRMYQFLTT